MNRLVSIHTFGCRLNQTESESIARAFELAGFTVAQDPAAERDAKGASPGIVVLNTCTVTSKAEQKARRLIRQALRDDPGAVVIVTGCYAEMEEEAIAALGDRLVVLRGSRKDALLGLPARLAAADAGHADPFDILREECAALSGEPRDPFGFAPSAFTFHSRASLKIEDGCDNACAFCRVRLARGPSLSLDPSLALERVRALEEAGYAEIVLTGVNLSQYSSGGLDFSGLLNTLVEGTARVAFRISSYEPGRIDSAFLEAVSRERVRPFFHLPLQSGSPATLARMGRDPDIQALRRAVEGLRRAADDPFISFDMICGFPGESEAEFAESEGLARDLRPAWIHIFPYSPRPDTPAASFRDRVPERVAAERAKLLSGLAHQGRIEYARRWTGRVVDAVLEGRLGRAAQGSPCPEKGPELAGEAFSANALRVGLYQGRGEGASAVSADAAKGSSLRLLLRPPLAADFDASAFIFINS
jgi:threonylcarbamoyladenosine tRNA methylthiotransferase MtaB